MNFEDRLGKFIKSENKQIDEELKWIKK